MSGNGLDHCVDRLVLRLKCMIVRFRSRHGIKFDDYHIGNRIDDQQLAAKSNARKSAARNVCKPPKTRVSSAAMTGPRRRRGGPSSKAHVFGPLSSPARSAAQSCELRFEFPALRRSQN
jgi:hypothetical protein